MTAPSLRVDLAASEAAYAAPTAGAVEIAGWRLVDVTPTLRAYLSPDGTTILLAVRGTNPTDLRDIAADLSIPANGLSASLRYRLDHATVRGLMAKYPTQTFVTTGHSLGSAVALQLAKDFPRIKSGVAFNGALQPSDLIFQRPGFKEIYNSNDPLYRSMGRFWRDKIVVPPWRGTAGSLQAHGLGTFENVKLPGDAPVRSKFDDEVAMAQMAHHASAPFQGGRARPLFGGGRGKPRTYRTRGHKRGHERVGGSFVSSILKPIRVAAEISPLARAIVGSPGQRTGWRPDYAAWIEAHRDSPIQRIDAMRKPIEGVLKTFLSTLSFGKIDQISKQQGYDKLFHLGLIIRYRDLRDGNREKTLLLEKNAIPSITFDPHFGPDIETSAVPRRHFMTLGDFLAKGQAAMGGRFWHYDPFNRGDGTNCQGFALAMLQANGLNTPDLQAWIFQDPESIARGLSGPTRGLMRSLVDTGARLEHALHGGVAGGASSKKRKRAPSSSPALEKAESKPLSDVDLKHMLGRNLHVLEYPKLSDYSRIEDVLDDEGRAVILFLSGGKIGHWVGILRTPGGFQYWDPYGKPPDEPFHWISKKEAQKLGETHQLTNLLRDAKQRGYQISWNTVALQTHRNDDNTCGRHVAARLYYKHLSAMEFITKIRASGMTPDDFVTVLTQQLLGHSVSVESKITDATPAPPQRDEATVGGAAGGIHPSNYHHVDTAVGKRVKWHKTVRKIRLPKDKKIKSRSHASQLPAVVVDTTAQTHPAFALPPRDTLIKSRRGRRASAGRGTK